MLRRFRRNLPTTEEPVQHRPSYRLHVVKFAYNIRNNFNSFFYTPGSKDPRG